jgi:hypothetical protein
MELILNFKNTEGLVSPILKLGHIWSKIKSLAYSTI